MLGSAVTDVGHVRALLPLDLHSARRTSSTCAGSARCSAALAAITAAVVGVILNLTVWFALHTLFAETREVSGLGAMLDMPVLSSIRPAALAIAALSFVMLFGLKWGMVRTMAVAAVLGAAWTLLGV